MTLCISQGESGLKSNYSIKISVDSSADQLSKGRINRMKDVLTA